MQNPRVWNPFSIEQWIAWIAATTIAAISLTTFFYANFETKADMQEYKNNQDRYYLMLEKRLDRIENKLDQILEK